MTNNLYVDKTKQLVIYQDDCLNIWNYLSPNYADMVITSPPYNVGKHKQLYEHHEDNISNEEYIKFIGEVSALLFDVLKRGGRYCLNINQMLLMPPIVEVIKSVGFIHRATIIWNKQNLSNMCLPGTELINTLRGYIPIKDVQVGDSVLTHKGRYRKVTKTFHRVYSGYLYDISVMGVPPVKVTEGHELYVAPIVRRTERNYFGRRVAPPRKRVRLNLYQWLPSEKLTSGFYVTVPIYKVQYHASKKAFNKRMKKITDVDINYYDEDFFRLLGYYIGDGSIHRQAVRIDFNREQQVYIDDVINIVKKFDWTYHFESLGESSENCVRIAIGSKNKLPFVMKRLCGDSVDKKYIHPFLMQSPFDLQKELIKGLRVSDGYNRHKEFTYTSVSEELIYQLRDLFYRLKIQSCIYVSRGGGGVIRGRVIKGGKCFRLKIHGKAHGKFCDILGEKSSKKYRNRIKLGSYHAFHPVTEVKKEFVNDLDVYNLEVEDDSSYVGKVTYHNCKWGSWKSPSNPNVIPPYEYILVFHKESSKHTGNKEFIDITKEEFVEYTNGLWTFAPSRQKFKTVKAAFPEELPYRLMKLYSYQHDIVIDPFMGTGTTAIVGGKLKRKVIGFEKYKEVFDEMIGNIEKQ